MLTRIMQFKDVKLRIMQFKDVAEMYHQDIFSFGWFIWDLLEKS